jgi:hypothetical protein
MNMNTHPYSNPEHWRIWRRAVANPAPADVDPVVAFPFRISPEDRVVTAGSCFAQHIARHLRSHGFNYFISEPAHPLLDDKTAELFNYGIYSARYGNIYSSRQLLQLFQRAHGLFVPLEAPWEEAGVLFDPFRPLIQPGGFATLAEFKIDQEQHFAAVRQAFRELDVFVFTLGLTECWESTLDGAVFPICPGTAHGQFNANIYRLHNLTVEETTADLRQFIALLHDANPSARILLTVSPVPLIATAEAKHVLAATTYSKSVLRVAAEMVAKSDQVAYFPSYEIIMGTHARGVYFGEDCRSVTEAGVEHVMRCFFRHATSNPAGQDHVRPENKQRSFDGGRGIVEIICEEESHDQPL